MDGLQETIPSEISNVSGNINSIEFCRNTEAHVSVKCCLEIVGLKVLSIRECPLVTPLGILSCLYFPFLRSFDYVSALEKVSSSFIVRILYQNPSLKSVAVNFETCEEEVMREEVNKLRPVKLVNLVICQRIYLNVTITLHD